MGEEKFRNQIYWLTCLFSILVVGVHSENAALFDLTEDSGIISSAVIWLQKVIAQQIGQIAVPGFFLVSGYLFYRKFRFSKLFQKWRSRIGTLFIPYVIWNLLYYIVYCVFSAVPILSAASGVEHVTWSMSGVWDAIVNYTYNPVFWYLFQLILLVVSAPFLYVLLCNRWVGMAALLCAWMAVAGHIQVGMLNADALVYYGTGAYLALHARTWMEQSHKKAGWISGKLCIVIPIILEAVSPLAIFPVPLVLLRLGIPLGLWLIMNEMHLPKVKEWMKGTFFVYATHFLIVRTLNKLGAMIWRENAFAAFFLYIVDIAMAFGAAWICKKVLGRFTPFLWKWISGGR